MYKIKSDGVPLLWRSVCYHDNDICEWLLDIRTNTRVFLTPTTGGVTTETAVATLGNSGASVLPSTTLIWMTTSHRGPGFKWPAVCNLCLVPKAALPTSRSHLLQDHSTFIFQTTVTLFLEFLSLDGVSHTKPTAGESNWCAAVNQVVGMMWKTCFQFYSPTNSSVCHKKTFHFGRSKTAACLCLQALRWLQPGHLWGCLFPRVQFNGIFCLNEYPGQHYSLGFVVQERMADSPWIWGWYIYMCSI